MKLSHNFRVFAVIDTTILSDGNNKHYHDMNNSDTDCTHNIF